MKNYYLKCYVCGKDHKETDSVTNCIECWWPIEVYYDYKKIYKWLNKYNLKTAPISALKYAVLYPIDDFSNIVSLNEWWTPLLHAENLWKEINIKNLYLKNEWMNPTWCFKDRWTMVEVTKAKEIWAKAICLASTGNMAASVAAYSTSAWIPCYVLVPEWTPVWKLAQTLTYWAKVIQIRSDYSACARLAVEMSKRFWYYLAWDYAFRTEWQKSQGYEIIEQLFWKSPDYVVCPIWCWTNLHAIYKWIRELFDMWLINKIPKIIWVQADWCCPITNAFEENRKDFDVQSNPYTIASAMCVWDPLDWKKVLDDIYESWWICVNVSDDEILKAQQEQARLEWVFAEPSWSMAYAAVKKLSKKNFFEKDDTIVLIINWNWLKDPKSPLKILPEPASIEPLFDELERFIDQKLYLINEVSNTEKQKLIFQKNPNDKEIKSVINSEFWIDPTDELISIVSREISWFFEKWKEIKKSDMQFILEEALNEIYLKNKTITITDFTVSTWLHQKAKAKICVKTLDKEICLEWEWWWTVDAAISALQNWLKEYDSLEVKLIDYEVEIDSKWADSTVLVKMTLIDKNWNKVISKTTSPDIVVASIKAFEKWFNLIYWKVNKTK